MNAKSNRFTVRALALIIVIAVLLFGGVSITGVAAQSSIPGDALYPVKTTIEQARLSLAQDAGDRALMKLAFAEQRLTEIRALIQEGRHSEVRPAVLAFEADINSAILEVETVSAANPARAARLAMEITSALTRYAQALSELAASSPESVRSEVTRALDTTHLAGSLDMPSINDNSNANDNGNDNANANEAGNDNANTNGNDNGDDNSNSNDNGDDSANANGDDNSNSNGNDDDNSNANGDDNSNSNGNDDDNSNANGDDNSNSNGSDDDNSNANSDDNSNSNSNDDDNSNANGDDNSGSNNNGDDSGNDNGDDKGGDRSGSDDSGSNDNGDDSGNDNGDDNGGDRSGKDDSGDDDNSGKGKGGDD